MIRPSAKLAVFVKLFIVFWLFEQCNSGPAKPRVLVFEKAEFYLHESTSAGEKLIAQLCSDRGIGMDVTEEAEDFADRNLRKYNAVIFLNTAGDVLNAEQQASFERYIHAGGNFLGIHTAIDTEHNWDWYGKMIGALYESRSGVEKAVLRVEEPGPLSGRIQDSSVALTDEWFNLKNVNPDIRVLLSLDENSYQGGDMGGFHPVSWTHDFEGGRVFITSLGHTAEIFDEPFFKNHLSEGLSYVLGDLRLPDYENLFVSSLPGDNKQSREFEKKSFVCNLYEPMEMEMMPDGRILFIERRGEIKIFNPENQEIKSIDKLNVYQKQEEGLLGLAIDPAWQQNHWIYLYYSPQDDKQAIRLSRFEFFQDKLIRSTEKVILKVATLVESDLNHAAGSLKFDANGFLYIATGDNTFAHKGDDISVRDGYSPSDDRKGHEAYDAQKSSANSMDLRGKILRIKPLSNGSYLCPAGNLYVKEDIVLPAWDGQFSDKAGPEDRVKGKLNPVALDDLIPLSSGDPVLSSYGRPEIFIMGVRNPFRIEFDNRSGTLFWGDVGPDAAFSDSISGSEGYDEVNAAKTAGFYGWPYFIGPNKAYRQFDYETGKPGSWFEPLHPVNKSRNNRGTAYLPPARPALIWYPFRSSDEFPMVANGTRCAMAGPVYYCDQYPEETRFPDAFNGRLLIYDWMRNWIMAVKLDSAGNYLGMERFAENLSLSRPIDMLIDGKGSLWVLEYGMEWYAQNKDACLSRIDFVNNKITPDMVGEGYANNTLSWNFYNRNRSFYQPGDTVAYKLEYGNPGLERLVSQEIRIDYIDSKNISSENIRKQKSSYTKGQLLIDQSDCKSCHALDKKINGPSYIDISARYYRNKSAPQDLANKVISGGTGNWGNGVMIAHPQLSTSDAGEMINWILSLQKNRKQRISGEGRYVLNIPETAENREGYFVLSAMINNQPDAVIVLHPAQVQVEDADSSSGGLKTYTLESKEGKRTFTEFRDQDFFLFRNIDLRGVRSVELAIETNTSQNHTGSGTVKMHLNGIEGPVAGSVDIPAGHPPGSEKTELIRLNIDVGNGAPGKEIRDLYFVINGKDSANKPVLGVDWVRFIF